MYENLPVVCFRCGWIGHPNDCSEKPANHPSTTLTSNNVMGSVMENQPSPMEVGPDNSIELGDEEERDQVMRPRLGLRVVTSEIRLLRATSMLAKGKKTNGV